jgi:malonyl-CoA reductase/3-hydroxypropionate dehydrogenase (NADP+)
MTTRRKTAATTGRLAGKVAMITGAGGNFGETLVRRYLEEGAQVVMVGRNRGKLESTLEHIRGQIGKAADRAFILPFDAADPGQARLGIETVVEKFGRLDVLLNNAGSTGPKTPLGQAPLTREEVDALRAAGANDTETVREAVSNLFGLTWNMCRAAAPHLKPGSSIINVSTIFSRTRYYGRAPYVVPKAALNTFSRHLALQLGPRGIRVNVIYPGPIESERIHNVFAAMDKLKKVEHGTTANDFLGTMALSVEKPDGTLAPSYPTIDDVAAAAVFLGSDESKAFAAQSFEVTNGMQVWQESRSTFTARPELRTLDGSGVTVLVAAGDQVADALEIARVQAATGAHVLLGLGSEEGVRAAQAALSREGHDRNIEPVLFDRSRAGTLADVLSTSRAQASQAHGPLHGAVILPAYGAYRFREPLCEVSDTDVDNFLTTELCGAISVARELTRFWKATAPRNSAPRAVFLSNGDDGAGNVYADILRTAIEELIRIWRDESELQVRGGDRAATEWSNQILRWSNPEDESLPFAAGQAARLLFLKRRIPQICLYVPVSIAESTGSQRSVLGWIESLMGLHLGKCVLITGGSAGIGGQLARLLAIGGARVMMTARGADALEKMRASIIRELEGIGYYQPQDRVHVLGDIDVGDERSLRRALDATYAAFGRVDYLINNAGVAGAEQMVVDMDPDAWRATLEANLNSNYSLIEKAVPRMKAQGSGYILNVSSYFGGEKYIAVPYPNRADYAVSKAGQRALVENLARFVGPEIQINAIAPGPVEGQRLKGKDGKAGLFDRRAKLIANNKRLNQLHGAIMKALEAGAAVDDVLDALAANDVGLLAHSATAPEPLRKLAGRIVAEGGGDDDEREFSCLRYLMTRAMALKLVARLKNGCMFAGEPEYARASAWVEALPEPPEPFLDPAGWQAEAEKIRKGVLGMLHLRRMPTETDVALATVFFMADRAISGETFEPSGGLHQERTITERELFGSAKQERVDRMEGETIWIIGEHMAEPIAAAARLFLAEAHVGSIMMLTRTAAAGEAIKAALGRALGHDRVNYLAVDGDLEAGLDAAFRAGGKPAAVISTPFAPIPPALFGIEGQDHLDAAGFADLVEANLTHHFRVARKVSLFRGTRLILVSPDVPVGGTLAQFAMANFVKTTLHAFTATLGVENERLYAGVPVNQVNLTRRMRSEEPRDAAEQAEEYRRFANAVLLAAAPIVEAEESRYRSRIYRGLAITV